MSLNALRVADRTEAGSFRSFTFASFDASVHTVKLTPNADALHLFGFAWRRKTSLARLLAKKRLAVFLRIDSVEQALRDLLHVKVEGEGYRLAYRIAADNLSTGMNVVADSCNPVDLTRREWQQVASSRGCEFRNIEVVCSDPREHRRRIETRTGDIQGLRLPNWQDVLNRDYEPWQAERVIVDTSGVTIEQAYEAMVSKLQATETE